MSPKTTNTAAVAFFATSSLLSLAVSVWAIDSRQPVPIILFSLLVVGVLCYSTVKCIKSL